MTDSKRLSFSQIKSFVNIQNGISLDSEFLTNEKCIENMKNGRLKLYIKRLSNKSEELLLKIFFQADSGSFVFRFFDSTNNLTVFEGVKGVWEVELANNSSLIIKKNTTSNGTRIILINSDVNIGEDCMFSDNVLLQSTDQHGLIDLNKKKFVNNYKKTINIKNHVWLARNTTVMPDVTVEEGSVIGTGSLATKSIPKTSVAVGVPAVVVKSGFTWSRFTNGHDDYSKTIQAEWESTDR